MGDMGEQRTAGRDMIHREYKDRLFRFIFGAEENREHILSLYNALRGTGYTDTDHIVITTLDEAVKAAIRWKCLGRFMKKCREKPALWKFGKAKLRSANGRTFL